jgi:hypothetical protein
VQVTRILERRTHPLDSPPAQAAVHRAVSHGHAADASSQNPAAGMDQDAPDRTG